MKVAVVGATGVLGRALVPQLIAAGYHARALVRTPEKARDYFGTSAEAAECDLLAPGIADELPALLTDCDAVIHAATAIPPQAEMGKPEAWERNTRLRLEGTTALIDGSLKVGAKVYLQQSIVMAYPSMGNEWIREDVPFYTDGRTNVTVIQMEDLVRAVPTNQMRWCILRGGTFVGKDTFQNDTIADLRAGKRKIPCDGSSFLPLIHVEDVASAFVAALDRAPTGSTYNIVAEPIRQRDYLCELAQVIGAPQPGYDPSLPCPPSQRCSNQAAREALDWTPTHGLVPRTKD